MLSTILKLLILVILFRIAYRLYRAFLPSGRGGRKKEVDTLDADMGEIEDADFEDLPDDRGKSP